MQVTFLGTGTSTGVPVIGCTCRVCMSPDPLDHRLRASVLINTQGKRLLIDCGPDLRLQMLKAGSPDINAVLITHSHYDHVGGIDDLRSFGRKDFPVYCTADVSEDLHNRVPYCFRKHPYPGAPSFNIHVVEPNEPFQVEGIEIIPLPYYHFKLPMIGYRIGKMAYITDCKTMPDSTIELLKGVDTLIINALRHKEHFSHLSLSEAIDIVEKVAPKRTFFTHMCHEIGLASELVLPEGMQLAHDMLTISV